MGRKVKSTKISVCFIQLRPMRSSTRSFLEIPKEILGSANNKFSLNYLSKLIVIDPVIDTP